MNDWKLKILLKGYHSILIGCSDQEDAVEKCKRIIGECNDNSRHFLSSSSYHIFNKSDIIGVEIFPAPINDSEKIKNEYMETLNKYLNKELKPDTWRDDDE